MFYIPVSRPLAKKYVLGMGSCVKETSVAFDDPLVFVAYARGDCDSKIKQTSHPELSGRYWPWVKTAMTAKLEAAENAAAEKVAQTLELEKGLGMDEAGRIEKLKQLLISGQEAYSLLLRVEVQKSKAEVNEMIANAAELLAGEGERRTHDGLDPLGDD